MSNEIENLKITFDADTSAFAEVIDSIYDVLRAGVILEDSLSDGFQLTDLFDALKLQPIVNEIINDVPEFAAQFLRLSPENAMIAVESAEEKLGDDLGKVTTFIIGVLHRLASSYAFADRTYKDAQVEIASWKYLLPTQTEGE